MSHSSTEGSKVPAHAAYVPSAPITLEIRLLKGE